MLRAPMSLQKITYDAATGTVIYRSKKKAPLPAGITLPSLVGAPANELAARARAAWARLIRKDPFETARSLSDLRCDKLLRQDRPNKS